MKQLAIILSFIVLGQLDCVGQCTRHRYSSNSTLNNFIRQHQILGAGNLQWAAGSYGAFASLKYFTPDSRDSLDIIIARGIWTGGISDSGEFRMAASLYGQNGVDFFNGPYPPSTNNLGSATCQYYGRVWRVAESQIEFIKERFFAGELRQEDIPIDILEWPAINNPWMGEFAPQDETAPFFDLNSDGSTTSASQ